MNIDKEIIIIAAINLPILVGLIWIVKKLDWKYWLSRIWEFHEDYGTVIFCVFCCNVLINETFLNDMSFPYDKYLSALITIYFSVWFTHSLDEHHLNNNDYFDNKK